MFTFKKADRLPDKRSFDMVFSDASKVSNGDFIVLFRATTCDHARIGFALSKKSIQKACQRNQVKRMLRESFRLRKLPAVDIVVLAKSGIRHRLLRDTQDIRQKLDKLWDSLSAKHNA